MTREKARELPSSRPNDSARTGGEWFLKILQALDVPYLFGTTGGGMPDIQDAMTEIRPPIWIQSLHEFPTVVAAMGYALASDQPAVCLIDRIVGTANGLGALYAAYENFAPIILFTSQNLPALASGKMPDGSPRRFGVHYHSWQSLLTTPWTKWRYELSHLEMLPASLCKAMMLANNEPTGPTHMTLRQDLMASRITTSPMPYTKKGIQRIQVGADTKSINQASKLLVEAEKPVLWATNMGRHISAVPLLVKLAETLGAPVLDGRNFMNFPMHHPLFLGFHTYRRTQALIENADLFVNIENYYEPPITPSSSCQILDIMADPTMAQGGSGGDYGGTYFEASCRLIGDSTTILQQLLKSLASNTDLSREHVSNRLQAHQAAHNMLLKHWQDEAQQHFDDDPVSPHRIAHELNQLWTTDTVWVNQTITMRQALIHGIFLNQPGTFFTNPSGHLGVTAGAAYGVALARPREKVIAMMGDGDFIFGNPPAVLWTCSHYQIPVLYLIFNNQCWGVEWPFLVDATLGLAVAQKNYEHVDLMEPVINFTKIAESMNVATDVIKHPDEAKHKLQWGLNTIAKGAPALIEIQIDKYTSGSSSYHYTFERPNT
ncbi:MAG: thiamine pyrophosphate-binding protein [Candidatus Bathyarchaeota archaeon]|nr:thiamine pyrophosphate-binding protein [Candidatus Bathyarchaeota archaeon]